VQSHRNRSIPVKIPYDHEPGGLEANVMASHCLQTVAQEEKPQVSSEPFCQNAFSLKKQALQGHKQDYS
jgi:hypothetical protein